MAECEKVCKYIDLPLQHASNPVLKRMKRPGTRQQYDALLGRIRDRVRGVSLRTTFIVGFPGETEDYFKALLEFIHETKFERLGIFTYSQEDGTRAGGMNGQVPDKVKQKRRELAKKIGLGRKPGQKRGRRRRQLGPGFSETPSAHRKQ
jgi:ribosomal protein S12 methylthiotransferase